MEVAPILSDAPNVKKSKFYFDKKKKKTLKVGLSWVLDAKKMQTKLRSTI